MTKFVAVKNLKTGLHVFSLAVGLGLVGGVIAPDQHSAFAQASARFSRVDVAGNQRIASDTVRDIAGIGAGQRVTPGQINKALQNLIQSGLFEDVDVRPEGGRLVIKVVEHPTINVIRIEGNRRLKDEALLSSIRSKSRRAFSPQLAERDAEAIANAYSTSGRLSTTVTPKIIRRSDNRVDLVFEVREGRITEISRITILGNRKYSDRRLRRILATKQAGIFHSLVKRDTLIVDRLEADKQLLREFYLNRGYIDFNVKSATPELSKSRNSVQLSLQVQEGQQYRFGKTSIISLESDIDADDYAKLNSIKSGSVYTPAQVENILERIDYRASSQGKNFIQAQPRVIRNDDTRTLDIEFEIVRGRRLFVERIDIEGNSTTLDHVIRNKFETVEGDTFNRRKVSKAADKVRATGFFENVDVQTREGSSPEQVILDVDVVEKATGSFGFGVAANTDSGLGVTIDVSEKNFLGRGQAVGLAFSTASDSRSLNLSFAEPELFGRDLRFSLDLGYNTYESDTLPYDTRVLSLKSSLGFPVSENGRLTLFAGFAGNEILTNDQTGAGNDDVGEASSYMQGDFGSTSTGLIGATYFFDKRNSIIEPTAGYTLTFTQEFAGFTGDRTYSKTSAKAKFFRSFYNDNIVVTAELEGGVLASSDGQSLITERFSLGGASLRGFKSGGVGPRDRTVDQALGGNKFVVGRVQASFPIGLPEEYGIYGGLFFEAGSIWGLDNAGTLDDSFKLRSSVGVSVFWDTAFGPLRFDFARAVKKQSYDELESFRFSISTRF